MPGDSWPEVSSDALSCPTDRNHSDADVESSARLYPEDPPRCTISKAAKEAVERALAALQSGDVEWAIALLEDVLGACDFGARGRVIRTSRWPS